MQALRALGRLADGREVRGARLEQPGGLALEIMDYGAIVTRLTVPVDGAPRDVVLKLASLAAYERDAAYQGCVAGRCANRIAGARFSLDGLVIRTEANEGENTLHGGFEGFGRRLWRFETVDPLGRSARLVYRSASGEAGFPGVLEAAVDVVLNDPATLTIAWSAEADAATPVNLTHHLYFNLGGDFAVPILEHSLQIAADAYLPVDEALIPTGEIAPVAGTPFDLRAGRPVVEALAEVDPQLVHGRGFDHNWVLTPGAEPAARLVSADGDLAMEIVTDQPGLQVYAGQGLDGPFPAYGGIALEPQAFPDAVHHPQFPDVVLRPGRVYRRFARYRFASRDLTIGR